MYRLPASHGENRGSSPLGSANDFNRLLVDNLAARRGLGRFWGLNIDGRQRLITHESLMPPATLRRPIIQHAVSAPRARELAPPLHAYVEADLDSACQDVCNLVGPCRSRAR